MKKWACGSQVADQESQIIIVELSRRVVSRTQLNYMCLWLIKIIVSYLTELHAITGILYHHSVMISRVYFSPSTF